eukprot:CAMPEP_0115263428 /NCGR_PEP_ID=MMETSP0270-20121206/49906_1 /TAXON_ID=71861 /ORGANISM="Scrippsiella trochoidea, Strain CCMP3099" /LENGTH=517 /DNA_ID=CAMNT_0002679411 /DNA_START=47 /DNA_END=1601 /DNA_ORIENTATION=-
MEGRTPSAAETLLAGLRELQSKGLLCDAVLAGAPGGKAGAAADETRLPAHQAVLAAASAPLRDFFLDGACNAAAVEKASDDPLLAAISGGAADAESVCAGLRQLRVKNQLCDVVVLAGGRRFGAHQAVLAAASAPLRRYIVDKLRELTSQVDSKGGLQGMPGLAAQPLELDLQSISSPEALDLALRHIYGEAAGPTKQPAEAVAQDLRQLASSLELPRLKAFAVGGQADDEPEKEEDQEEEPELPTTATQEGAAEEDTPPPSQAEKPITDLERALYAMRSCRFASTGDVPEAPTIDEEPADKADAKILAKLREAFFERPAWLDQALLKRLPGSTDEAQLLRLLPYVAYQWQDGPWSKAYSRYGWDPREEEEAEEAKTLQVLQFRDPHFRKNDAEAADTGPADCSFRKPPTQKTQLYQLVDIQDDYITSLIDEAELLDCVDKKSGWLPQFVLEVAGDRLKVKSQQLREKIALRASSAASSTGRGGKASGRGAKRRSFAGKSGGRGAGNKAKRTRVGGG